MIRINGTFFSFLIPFLALQAQNEFEKNNNLLLTQSIELLKANNTTDISALESTYLKNIEEDIQQQVAQLNPDLKQALGNFEHNYDQFKKKIILIKLLLNAELSTLIKDSNEDWHKNNLEIVKEEETPHGPITHFGRIPHSHWDISEEDFLFTLLGLKPTSIVDGMDSPLNIGLLTKVYPAIHKTANLIHGTFTQPEVYYDKDSFEYMTCSQPLIPFAFIKKSYPTINTSPLFGETFNELHQTNDHQAIEEFISQTWKNGGIQPADNLALLLGYTPTAFEKLTEENIYAHFLQADASHFRQALIPGVISTTDRSADVKLYEKLIEYAIVKLCGLEYYIKNLEFQFKANLQEEHECRKNFEHIEKVIQQAVTEDQK